MKILKQKMESMWVSLWIYYDILVLSPLSKKLCQVDNQNHKLFSTFCPWISPRYFTVLKKILSNSREIEYLQNLNN